MNLLVKITLCAFMTLSMINLQGQEAKITKTDINNLVGEWEGSLTYLDYSSNKPYSMPCNASISVIEKMNHIKVSYTYPNEPKANSKFKLKVSKDGTKIDKEKLTSRTTDEEGNIVLTIEKPGKDGNEQKTAMIRQSYIIGVEVFIVRKEVKFTGTTDWLVRNEYKFTKTE